MPQALRIIIPPLTSQYLNLTKNSSLAIAVGYPDLVGDRRHRPQPDRPGGRGGRDLDGGLSRHQPRDLGLHELVQRQVGAGGAVGMQSTTSSYVRARWRWRRSAPRSARRSRRLAADEPVRDDHRHHPDPASACCSPPSSSCRWSAGASSTRSGSARTAASAPRSRRAASSRTAGPAPAGPSSRPSSSSSCSAAIPIAERWRVVLTAILFVALLVPLVIPRVPYKALNAIVFFGVFPVVGFILLIGARCPSACSACWRCSSTWRSAAPLPCWTSSCRSRDISSAASARSPACSACRTPSLPSSPRSRRCSTAIADYAALPLRLAAAK